MSVELAVAQRLLVSALAGAFAAAFAVVVGSRGLHSVVWATMCSVG